MFSKITKTCKSKNKQNVVKQNQLDYRLIETRVKNLTDFGQK